MEGRLKDTLPQSIENCGYRTLMLFPMSNGFDREAQGAPT
jgi:hypothetical protein